MEKCPTGDAPARIAFQLANANTQPGGGAHFVLDVVAYKPETGV
jgi:hypothetical protein